MPNFRDAFLHVEGDAHAEEAVGQYADDILAQIFQQLRMAIHHADLHAQRGKNRNEFARDDAAAHDQQAVGQVAQVQDGGGIQHRLFVERNIGRAARPGAAGEHDEVGRYAACLARRIGDLDGVRIDERGLARDQRHAMAQQALQDDRLLLRDHAFLAPHRVRQQAVTAATVGHECLAHAAGARKQIGHFAHGLAGNGAGLQSGAADLGFAFDDRGALAHARRLPGRMLSGGAGTDDEYVVVHVGSSGDEMYSIRSP